MTDDEFNRKMERGVSKTTPKTKRRKKRKTQNPYQLWTQLNEEMLRKLGYIK